MRIPYGFVSINILLFNIKRGKRAYFKPTQK